MQLSTEEIQNFKQLYLAETGVELTDEHAAKEACRLLALIKFAIDPMPEVDGLGADENN